MHPIHRPDLVGSRFNDRNRARRIGLGQNELEQNYGKPQAAVLERRVNALRA
jgi:hypothetical protein